ncbi:MAG: hypothetical protein ACPL7K_08000 [Armatimonadota bacterium]
MTVNSVNGDKVIHRGLIGLMAGALFGFVTGAVAQALLVVRVGGIVWGLLVPFTAPGAILARMMTRQLGLPEYGTRFFFAKLSVTDVLVLGLANAVPYAALGAILGFCWYLRYRRGQKTGSRQATCGRRKRTG